MRVQREHRIEMPMARYIELMFDPEFDKRMNLEAMNSQAYQNLERSVDGPSWVMRSKITPQDNMPGFLKKLLGGSFYFDERRTHQKGSDTASGELTPSSLKDKVRMTYKIRLVPDGENACRRIMEWDVEVKIFGVGGQIEKFAAGEMERGMDVSARFFNQQGRAAAK